MPHGRILFDKTIVARLEQTIQSTLDGAAAGFWGHIGITLLACMGLCGCFSFGTTRLYEDQLGYSRALGDAEKSDTLLNVVRICYSDAPIILQATQVIAGYQLQRNVTGGFEVFRPEIPAPS
jgi:hypothetical protein